MIEILTFLEELSEFIQEGRRHKLSIFCIGNVLKGDDALGPIIAKKLQGQISSDVLLFDTGSQPENFITELRRNNISHCLMIDALEFKGKPGNIGFFDPTEVSDFYGTFSTHYLSMKSLIDFMIQQTGSKFRILGIQPFTLEIGKQVSTPVQNSIERLIKLLKQLLE